MKKVLTFAGVIVVILIGGVLFFSGGNSQEQNTTPVNQAQELPLPDHLEYYWGNGCPHCAVVQEFYDSWENYDKANIEKFETWYNRDNANRLISRAKQCDPNVKDDQIGVPMLFTPEGECINGDEPIINYLKNKNFDQTQEGQTNEETPQS